jgi:hypothetical protein
LRQRARSRSHRLGFLQHGSQQSLTVPQQGAGAQQLSQQAGAQQSCLRQRARSRSHKLGFLQHGSQQGSQQSLTAPQQPCGAGW